MRKLLPLVFVFLTGCNKILPTAIDLVSRQTAQTQIWFNSNVGSPDLLEMYGNLDSWQVARSKIDVIQFHRAQVFWYDGWQCPGCGPNTFPNLLSANAFQQIISWNKKISIESPALKSHDCHNMQIEIEPTINAINNIKSAGGRVDYISMDEPFNSGLTQPPNGCGFTPDQSVLAVREYVMAIRGSAPEVQVGLTEPYPALTVLQLENEINLMEANGITLPFFHLDFYYRTAIHNDNYKKDLKALKDFCAQRHIAFGMIYWGDDNLTSEEYLEDVTNEALAARGAVGITDQTVFESWSKFNGELIYPFNLPESNPTSHTAIVTSIMNLLRN